MQMKLFSLIILVSTVLISLTSICYSRDKEMVVLEQGLDSVINGIDIEKGELKPGSPQAEKQAAMSNSLTGFNQLNVDLSKVISQIGAYGFSSFTEFIDRNNIVALKDNLRKYGNAKKHYFDRVDDLLNGHGGRLGYGSDITGRLGRTVYQLIEKLENIYIADLGKFYDFVLQNHGKIEFSGDQVYFESDKMTEEFDKLWNKTVASTTVLTTAQKEIVILEQNLDSVINGIDIEEGELKPGSPQAEKQAVMSNGITGFNRLNVDLSKVISQIGAFEFSSFTEFIDRNNIVVLKDNLRKYGNAKKHYFDRMDDLLKRYRGQLGYGSDITERLGGTVHQLIEKLENIYIADLSKFYDFVLQNHSKIEFSGDQAYFESDKMVEEFDKLWNKTVASTTELTLNGIDIEKGELEPGSPQAKKQPVMSNGITGFSRLNVDLSKVISQIGAFEFSSFTEFIDRNNIVVLKDNLRKYGNAKKHYFDRMDDLLKRYRGQLGYGSDITERLGGTVYQFIEKLEYIYIADLGKFYDFVLQNHGKMEFSGDQVYFESDKMVEEFDKLWNKTVASTTELTTAQAVAAEIMTNAINEVKDEPNGKSKE